MKSGIRALGIAESYRGDSSTLAGVVCRASRVIDGFVFGSCTVGGTDATAAIVDLWDRLDREDVRYVLIAGIAPAWYNIVDLSAVHDAVDRPVLSVSFEESEGLEPSIREEFDSEAAERRLETYRTLPERDQVTVDGKELYARSVGLEAAPAEVVRGFTPEGGRPEPLRVARLAARAADQHDRA
ncbi:endonuclease dU [Halovenus sp. HT40]|uniref:endonuclease dU n=1 Tax=Halovenus sp. HT40 TaxID=3126691 RepID=UPI00300E827D